MTRPRLRRAIARRLPTPVKDRLSSSVAERRERESLDAILAAGVFDREYYEAQTGKSYGTDAAACAHYLARGRQAGHAPHPLFEPSAAQPSRWRKAVVDPLVDDLTGSIARNGVPNYSMKRDWGKRADTGRAEWVEWVAAADDSTEFPLRGDGQGQVPTTWGQFRAAALEAAAAARALRASVAAPKFGTAPPATDPSLDDATIAPSPDGAPVVSIILPTWNRASLLRRAVESVRTQTFVDWELIVIDDGSDDDTRNVLEGLRRGEPRLVVLAERHGGVCRARNAGIAAARGRYIAFLDSDNTWTPEFLQRTVATLETNADAGWAHAGLQLERDGTTRYLAHAGSRDRLLVSNYIDLNVLVARRDVVDRVGGFDPGLERAVDYDLILRLAAVSPPKLVPAIGAVYADELEVERISTSQPQTWNEVVALRYLLEGRTPAPTVPGRISVVLPVPATKSLRNDVPTLIDALLGESDDVEVIVMTVGGTAAFLRSVSLLAANRPRLRVLHWPLPTLQSAAVVDLAAVEATGEHLVVWPPQYLADPGWLAPLLEALRDPATAVAQPLVLDADGLIHSAGATFAGRDLAPYPLLGGLPIEDATQLGTRPVPAALSGVVALRTRDFRDLSGFDPIYGNAYAETDLSLRAASSGAGRTVVVADARVRTRQRPVRFGMQPDVAASVSVLRRRHPQPDGSTEAWGAVGFDVVGRRLVPIVDPPTSEAAPEADPSAPRGVAPLVRPAVVTETPAALRWVIDTSAPPGRYGDGWGDSVFAQSLATALRELGQAVHVDRATVRDGWHRDLDDVTLVLRGQEAVTPHPGGIALLWVVSNPDSVSGRECARYDRVFAVGSSWAAEKSETWDVVIEPLDRCTDPARFRPDAAEPDTGPELVFVGNSHDLFRSSVQYAIEAGHAPAVWGGRWNGLIAEEYVRDDYLANDEVAALYASAGGVLCDHWEDQRAAGFTSTRVYDVLAAGGRLISDDIRTAVPEPLRSGVVVYHDRNELAEILAGEWRQRFPDRSERLRLSELVRSEYTYAARARSLVDAAMAARTGR